MKRRKFLRTSGALIAAGLIMATADGAEEKPVEPVLTVAVVQARSTRDVAANTASICKSIRECAARGARIVTFPECVLTGYFDSITGLSQETIARAVRQVASACSEARVYALVGTAWRENGTLLNSAFVISPSGAVIERYDKIQLAEQWPEGGNRLSVFKVDGVPCSIIICHDERYPELVRLPVLVGAQVVFYISHESALRWEEKLGPYRAQIQARAVENTVFVVHANAPANDDASGSHGQSRILAPDGNIIEEASMFREDVLVAKLELKQATRSNALNSIKRGPLRDWWKEGMKLVRVVE